MHKVIFILDKFFLKYEWGLKLTPPLPDLLLLEGNKILFVPYNTKEIRLACKSEYNFKRNIQVILLMITDAKKWHYLAVKSLSELLRGITSNHNGDSYCLNCFHSYSELKNMKKYVMIMIIVM